MSAEVDFDEKVAIPPILAAIFVGVLAALGTFTATESPGVSVLAYMFVACLSYVVLWVVGYA